MGFWSRRWSSGAANSAASRPPNTPRAPAAITTPTASPCGWPAAASRAASPSAKPTNWAAPPSKTVPRQEPARHHPHQLGLDPDRLTYFYSGLDQKLVGVEVQSPSARSSPDFPPADPLFTPRRPSQLLSGLRFCSSHLSHPPPAIGLARLSFVRCAPNIHHARTSGNSDNHAIFCLTPCAILLHSSDRLAYSFLFDSERVCGARASGESCQFPPFGHLSAPKSRLTTHPRVGERAVRQIFFRNGTKPTGPLHISLTRAAGGMNMRRSTKSRRWAVLSAAVSGVLSMFGFSPACPVPRQSSGTPIQPRATDRAEAVPARWDLTSSELDSMPPTRTSRGPTG